MNSALDKIPVSVLIPAKNEERNIRASLESLRRADEIFVVDSQSSDRTV
ncbi:MAG: glycosyltransferase [Hormoscilla sp. GM102CHS1]|nr:glycosyltransferase [Hormoscilla sp. GM102CHS1]